MTVAVAESGRQPQMGSSSSRRLGVTLGEEPTSAPDDSDKENMDTDAGDGFAAIRPVRWLRANTALFAPSDSQEFKNMTASHVTWSRLGRKTYAETYPRTGFDFVSGTYLGSRETFNDCWSVVEGCFAGNAKKLTEIAAAKNDYLLLKQKLTEAKTRLNRLLAEEILLNKNQELPTNALARSSSMDLLTPDSSLPPPSPASFFKSNLERHLHTARSKIAALEKSAHAVDAGAGGFLYADYLKSGGISHPATSFSGYPGLAGTPFRFIRNIPKIASFVLNTAQIFSLKAERELRAYTQSSPGSTGSVGGVLRGTRNGLIHVFGRLPCAIIHAVTRPAHLTTRAVFQPHVSKRAAKTTYPGTTGSILAGISSLIHYVAVGIAAFFTGGAAFAALGTTLAGTATGGVIASAAEAIGTTSAVAVGAASAVLAVPASGGIHAATRGSDADSDTHQHRAIATQIASAVAALPPLPTSNPVSRSPSSASLRRPSSSLGSVSDSKIGMANSMRLPGRHGGPSARATGAGTGASSQPIIPASSAAAALYNLTSPSPPQPPKVLNSAAEAASAHAALHATPPSLSLPTAAEVAARGTAIRHQGHLPELRRSESHESALSPHRAASGAPSARTAQLHIPHLTA